MTHKKPASVVTGGIVCFAHDEQGVYEAAIEWEVGERRVALFVDNTGDTVLLRSWGSDPVREMSSHGLSATTLAESLAWLQDGT